MKYFKTIYVYIPAYRSISDSVGKFLKQEVINVISIPLPAEIWGDTDEHNNELKKSIGLTFDVHQVIGEHFLTAKSSNIIFDKLNEKNNRDRPINNSFYTAQAWHRACDGNIAKYGLHSEHDGKLYRNVIIPVSFSEDETALNSGKNKPGEPGVMNVLNFTNEDAYLDLIGMAPPQTLPMPYEMAHDHLKRNRKFLRKIDRVNAIALTKRYIHFEYIKQIITQLYKYNESGFFLQAGEGTDNMPAEIVVARVMCFFLEGDNKALDYLSLIASSVKGRKCRICNELNMGRFTAGSKNWIYRDHLEMKEKNNELYLLSIDQIKRNFEKARKRSSKSIPKEELDLELDLLKFSKDWNCVGGNNILYEIGDKLRELDPTHPGFHMMTPPDELHTLLLGALKYCVVWCFSIFYLLQTINSEKYGNIVSQIDENMKYFPRKQSVEPFLTMNMPNGFSPYFTAYRNATQNQRLSGGLPAMRYPGIIYMLMFSIGFDGSILPTKIEIDHKRKQTQLRTQLDNAVNGCNIETIVMNALQSCLHVVSFSRRDEGYTEEHYNLLEKLIAVNRAHLNILFDTRNLLKHIVKNDPIIIKKQHIGHKQHLMEHLPEFIRELGPKKIFDTETSEKFHIVIKGAFDLLAYLLQFSYISLSYFVYYCLFLQ